MPCCIASYYMLQCGRSSVGGATMATPKFFRRQAAASAILAKQTYDEDSRQRCLRLEQAFLHLAKTEEQFAGGDKTSGLDAVVFNRLLRRSCSRMAQSRHEVGAV